MIISLARKTKNLGRIKIMPPQNGSLISLGGLYFQRFRLPS